MQNTSRALSRVIMLCRSRDPTALVPKSRLSHFFISEAKSQHPQHKGRKIYLGLEFVEVSVRSLLTLRQNGMAGGSGQRTAVDLMASRKQREWREELEREITTFWPCLQAPPPSSKSATSPIMQSPSESPACGPVRPEGTSGRNYHTEPRACWADSLQLSCIPSPVLIVMVPVPS